MDTHELSMQCTVVGCRLYIQKLAHETVNFCVVEWRKDSVPAIVTIDAGSVRKEDGAHLCSHVIVSVDAFWCKALLR